MSRQIRILAAFIGFLTFQIEPIQAQENYSCGTQITETFRNAQNRAVPGYFGCEQFNRVDRKFSVLFQVVKDSLGGNGITDANLTASINRLNNVWAPTGMTFEFCERRDLDNHQFNNFIQAEQQADMLAMYYEPNIINVFIVNSIVHAQFGEVGGYAFFPGGPDVILVNKLSMQGLSYGVLIHEMGHFFGLFHTFETDFGNELVNGFNCASTGDLVCDTEANPTDDVDDFIQDADCNYTGQPASDANGDFYVPPSKNFMSYSPCGCQFTKQQYNRMVEQYLDFRNYLW